MEKHTLASSTGENPSPRAPMAPWLLPAGLGLVLVAGSAVVLPGPMAGRFLGGIGAALAAVGIAGLHARERRLRADLEVHQAQIRKAELGLRSYISVLPTGAMTIDARGRMRLCNHKALELLGCTEEELARIDWAHPSFQVLKVDGNSLDPAELPMNVARNTGHKVPGQILGIERPVDGDWAWVTCSAHPVLGGRGSGEEVICTLEDATLHRNAETELAVQTFRDRLTGLPNRTLFMERLSQAILRSDRRRLFCAVLFLDLDRFKVINDSLSHEAGDQLLVQVAKRLTSCIRPEDTVAHLSGDEFAVLFEDIPSVNEGLSVADRIVQSHGEPFHLQDQEVFITCSMGIALSSSAETHPPELIRDAEVAMYRAKAKGQRAIEVFDPSMNAQAIARFQMESEMRRGLERSEFILHYQPLVGLKSGRIEGWEALVRWKHPERGLVPPGEFIPLAEETGFIVPLGRWVLGEACRRAAEWERAYPADRHRRMNVNLSAHQFAHRDLVNDVMQALVGADLDPRCLKLELTESVMMRDPLASLEIMKVFKDMNIDLVMDDFGTGYSSLSYLKRFPLETLKVDKSFIDGLGNDPESSAIVKAIISLAKSLGMNVTAEGIESYEQVTQLQDLNCDQGQGFYFSRPMPPDAAANLLKEEHAGVGRSFLR